MKQLITSIALKFIPEDGFVRKIAKRVYSRLYPKTSIDVIHRTLTADEENKLKDAVRIGFVGDLILLRDMVDIGNNNGGGVCLCVSVC